MRKTKGTSEGLDFLIFHHVAVDPGFAAGRGVVVVCVVGVRAGCLVICCGAFGVAAGPAAVWVSARPPDSRIDLVAGRKSRGDRSGTAALLPCS